MNKKITLEEYEVFQEQLDILINQVINRIQDGHGHPGDTKERADILLKNLNIEVEEC